MIKLYDKIVYIKDNPLLTFEKVYDLIGCSPSYKYCVPSDSGYCIWENADNFITFKEYRKRKLLKLEKLEYESR